MERNSRSGHPMFNIKKTIRPEAKGESMAAKKRQKRQQKDGKKRA